MRRTPLSPGIADGYQILGSELAENAGKRQYCQAKLLSIKTTRIHIFSAEKNWRLSAQYNTKLIISSNKAAGKSPERHYGSWPYNALTNKGFVFLTNQFLTLSAVPKT